MATDSRRLSILSGQEIEGLYGLPRFTEDDRQVFFDLSPVEREVVDAVHAISTAVQPQTLRENSPPAAHNIL